MGKRGIPDRWLDYKAVGEKIEGFPIRACKVPLKQTIVHGSLQREQWFTPRMLIESVPDVGCVVDLTATSRYYDPHEFTRHGIRHVKIFCEGHVIPSAQTVERFYEAMNEFLGHSISKDKVLLVHCTHGLNRTGYLVVRYMVEQRGFEPQDAIRAFNAARGHNIERTNYLADLQERKANSVPIAPTPSTVFSKVELLDEPQRGEQTTRDRNRRRDHGRSWSRECGTNSRHETRGRSYDERSDRRDRHNDRHNERRNERREPRSPDDGNRQRYTWRADPSNNSAKGTHTRFDSEPEPEAPGAVDASSDPLPAVDPSKPPRWKIPKKIRD